jgi:cell division protein FtsB
LHYKEITPEKYELVSKEDIEELRKENEMLKRENEDLK